MNEYLDLYEVEVGQSSRGTWYCKSLKIAKHNLLDLKASLNLAIMAIDGVLKERNDKSKTSEETP